MTSRGELVAAAKEDADRLLHTLNDLLDLARLEHGSAPLQITNVAPAELVGTVERSMREVAHSAGVGLKTEVASGLPPVPIDSRIAYALTN